jgi:hypothetical protein
MPASAHEHQGSDTANNLNVLLFVAHAWATSVEVFLHTAPGSRYLGFQALAVLLLVPFNVLFWEGHDVRALLWFIPAYFLACIIARIGMLRRWRRGETCHSYYSGTPRLMGPKAKCTELTFKRFVEPVVLLAVGFLVRQLGEAPFGTYLMVAAACLFISVNAGIYCQQVQVMDMRDAVIGQEILAERFRESRREH